MNCDLESGFSERRPDVCLPPPVVPYHQGASSVCRDTFPDDYQELQRRGPALRRALRQAGDDSGGRETGPRVRPTALPSVLSPLWNC